MITYIIKRITYAIPILIGINLITFALFFMVNTPDDMARMHLGTKHVKRENIENWSVLVNAPRHDPGNGWDWSRGGAEYAQKIINKLDSLGLEVSSRLEVMEFRTPLDLQNFTNAPGGSIYGASNNGAKSAFMRAKNRSPVSGLYCVGGSAHPGGGLPLVGMSAELVAHWDLIFDLHCNRTWGVLPLVKRGCVVERVSSNESQDKPSKHQCPEGEKRECNG